MKISDNYVALLGTKGGPAIRPGSAMPTASLLQMNGQMALIDCGLGVTKAVVDQGFPLKEISLIFITHLHSDHYLELGPLLHTAWVSGLKSPVRIWGPSGLADYWKSFLSSMKVDIAIRIEDEGRPDIADLISISSISEGEFFACDSFNVSAIANIHPPLSDSFALRFRSPKHKVVFSGDTAYLTKLIDFAQGADLLIHEAMLEAALGPLMRRIGNADDRLMKHWLRSHTLAHNAAKLASSAKVKALALHHLIPADDPDFTDADWKAAIAPHFDGPFFIGRDGMQIDYGSLVNR